MQLAIPLLIFRLDLVYVREPCEFAIEQKSVLRDDSGNIVVLEIL